MSTKNVIKIFAKERDGVPQWRSHLALGLADAWTGRHEFDDGTSNGDQGRFTPLTPAPNLVYLAEPMSNLFRQVFVISDLHLGGAFPEHDDGVDRGFRMMTHPEELARFIGILAARPPKPLETELVINGDFVDFLAEPSSENDATSWQPFQNDPETAAHILRRIASRGADATVFKALAAFLANGHRLTILLGNHDIELALPRVRRELETILKVDERRIHFIYDGEAYVVGDALIEHGNRYDRFNVVDHSRLRRLRSLQSRKQRAARQTRFRFGPPCGSVLVSNVMNPIKRKFPFIDLLKPEKSAAIPTLLALAPQYRWKIARTALTLSPARKHGLESPGLPAHDGDISATPETAHSADDMADNPSSVDESFSYGMSAQVLSDANGFDDGDMVASNNEEPEVERHLIDLLTDVMSPDDATRFIAEISAHEERAEEHDDIGVLSLLLSPAKSPVTTRLGALLDALRKFQNRASFCDTRETEPEYLDSATKLAQDGHFRFIIFGHTHLAKRVRLIEPGVPHGAHYLNSGTWCDLIRVPDKVLGTNLNDARVELEKFIGDIESGALGNWIHFRPTYVRVDMVDEYTVENAYLEDFNGEIVMPP